MTEYVREGLFFIGTAVAVVVFGLVLGLVGRALRSPDGPGH